MVDLVKPTNGPEKIYLDSYEGPHYGEAGRMWCEDDDPSGEGGPWIEYVRHDVHEAALSSARAEIERLREALKPFAELAKHFTNAPDDGWIWRAEEPLEITVGHLRCAAAALIREQEE